MPTSDTIALIFDFDDTLAPDSTTLLLKKHGIDAKKFWGTEFKSLMESGYDPPLAYLKLILDKTGQGRPLGHLTNKDLRTFGSSLDSHFMTGIPQIFRDLKKMVARTEGIQIEFYIISGGLREIIIGSKIVRDNFKEVYGCEFEEGGNPARICGIKRAVSFTEKTRYIFEINKGLAQASTRKNPYQVNQEIPEGKRRILFENMIYVGDGLTDIPCFSLVKKLGGTPFGVFDPGDPVNAKKALLDFLRPKRVISMHAPRYGPKGELGALLRAAVSNLCGQIVVRRQAAER